MRSRREELREAVQSFSAREGLPARAREHRLADKPLMQKQLLHEQVIRLGEAGSLCTGHEACSIG